MNSENESDSPMEVDDVDEVDDGDKVQTFNAGDREAELEKAKATQNQLRIWDVLLEARILMQRLLLEANKLPQPDLFKEIMKESKGSEVPLEESSTKAENSVKDLLDVLLELSNLMDEDKETESEELSLEPGPKRRKLEEYETVIQDNFQKSIPHRNEIIQTWNDKTQLLYGKFKGKNTAGSQNQIPTIKQIEHILSDKPRLIKRTQIKRSSYETIGKSDTAESQTSQDPEIFDDDDFYHQLLRELIDRKTSNANESAHLSQHWLDLQKLRTKFTRAVDTKASKGRRVRYDVHPKLVNFMAPQDNCVMSDTAYRELMSSLFGKLQRP